MWIKKKLGSNQYRYYARVCLLQYVCQNQENILHTIWKLKIESWLSFFSLSTWFLNKNTNYVLFQVLALFYLVILTTVGECSDIFAMRKEFTTSTAPPRPNPPPYYKYPLMARYIIHNSGKLLIVETTKTKASTSNNKRKLSHIWLILGNETFYSAQ